MLDKSKKEDKEEKKLAYVTMRERASFLSYEFKPPVDIDQLDFEGLIYMLREDKINPTSMTPQDSERVKRWAEEESPAFFKHMFKPKVEGVKIPFG